MKEYAKRQSAFSFAVRNFSPAWFSMTMGVGISASILYSFPFQRHGLHIAGMIVWGANIVLFAICSIMLALRLVTYPDQRRAMIQHTGQSMFLGTIPMGLCTIVNMTSLVCKEYGLKGGWQAVYALWLLDSTLSVACCVGVAYVMFAVQKRTTVALNATILLPIVPLVVAASCGGFIAPNMPAYLRPSTLVVSFMMWSVGQVLAGLCMAVYVFRLLTENVQPRAIVLSTLLPVGPMGQGAFGIMLFGRLYHNIFEPEVATVDNMGIAVMYQASSSAVVISTAVAVLLMSMGLFWMTLTAMFTIRTPPPGFNQSWWALTFPIGTMTLAWYQLATEYDSIAFRYVGAVFGCFVLAAVCVCLTGSVKYALLSDTLFKQAAAETDPSSES